jgi:hypothetical protein
MLVRIGYITRSRADSLDKFESVQACTAQFRCRMPLTLNVAFER